MKNELNLKDRVKAPTPKFFRKLRNIGLSLVAVGAAVLGAPIALPAIAVKVAGYLAVAGTVLSAASQATVDEKELQLNQAIKKGN